MLQKFFIQRGFALCEEHPQRIFGAVSRRWRGILWGCGGGDTVRGSRCRDSLGVGGREVEQKSGGLVGLFVLRFFVRLKLPSGKRTGLARDTALSTVCECVLIDILNKSLDHRGHNDQEPRLTPKEFGQQMFFESRDLRRARILCISLLPSCVHEEGSCILLPSFVHASPVAAMPPGQIH